MIRSKCGEVLEIRERWEGMTRLLVAVEGRREQAVNFDALTGTPEVGDQVLLNTTAVHLGLGTGGEHFVMANLSRPEVDMREGGHIMKARYMPCQVKVLAVEEEASPHRKAMEAFAGLEGMVVVAGSLHSMLAPIAAGIRAEVPEARIAYVMTDGGALPLALSDTVRQVKARGLIESTITTGHAFGGDYEAVTVHSGLVAAKQVARADAAIVLMGPGGVGTGTEYGFTGIELGEIINAAHSLGGRPAAALRMSFADPRDRHRGISHHTVTALRTVALAPADVAVPALGGEARDALSVELQESGIAAKHRLHEVDGEPALRLLQQLGIEPRTMGRSLAEDRDFFVAAGSAGVLAGRLVNSGDTIPISPDDKRRVEAPPPRGEMGIVSPEFLETTVGTRRVYEGKVVNLRVDEVELPNGARSRREVVEHNDSVAIVPVLDDGRIILIRQFRLPAGRVLLEIPAGVVEPGESPAESAGRELAEEIGYEPGRLELLFSMYLAPGYSSELIHVFVGTALSRAPRAPDADEFIEPSIVTPQEARRLIADGSIRDAKTIAGLLGYLRDA